MRHRQSYDHDPEQLSRGPADGLPLFEAATPRPNPPAFLTAPPDPAPLQQGPAPADSIDAKYATWRRTEPGARAFRSARNTALEMVASGAQKLAIDQIVWRVRGAVGISVNNSFRALLARELEASTDQLRGLFEKRKRSVEDSS